MWATKIVIPYHRDQLLSPLTKKYGITVLGFPLSLDHRKNALHCIAEGVIQGENIHAFLRSLRKDRCVVNLEYHEELFLIEFRLDPAMKNLFEPGVIHRKPMMIDSKGETILELGSMAKEKLLPFIALATNGFYNGKLVWIKQVKLSSLLMMTPLPKLSEQQRKALALAVSSGYYACPRKTYLKTLAKKMNVSYATFQFHLRHAEKKLFPTLYSIYVDKKH